MKTWSLSGLRVDFQRDESNINGKRLGPFSLASIRKQGEGEVARLVFHRDSRDDRLGDDVITHTNLRVRPGIDCKNLKVRKWKFRLSNIRLRTNQLGAIPAWPTNETPLAEFLMSLPAVFVANRRLPLSWLRKIHENLDHIFWQESLCPPRDGGIIASVIFWRRRMLFRILSEIGVNTRKSRNCGTQFEDWPRAAGKLIAKGFPFSDDSDEVRILLRQLSVGSDTRAYYVLSMMAWMVVSWIFLLQRGIRA